ncbi:MAG: hypothetical protein ACC662_04155, partial [Planctomycetota bacterium]
MATSVSRLFALRGRLAGRSWSLRGRVARARGQVPAALTAFERAVACRPRAFGPLMDLARSYLDIRETWRAHRTLAQAREVDPGRFARVVTAWIARDRA